MVAIQLNIPRVFHADSGIFPDWSEAAEEWERDDEVDRELIESSSSVPSGVIFGYFQISFSHLSPCPSSILQHSLWGFELLHEIVISVLQLRFPFP